MLNLSLIQWIVIIFSAINVGFAKTGLQGATMPAVIFMALAFGGQLSTSIMLIMLIIGDAFAVKRYGRSIDVKNIFRLLPSTLVGVIAGAVIGTIINDQQFMALIAIIVFICLFLLVYQEFNKSLATFKDNRFISSVVGMLNGFASMVGNASGPIFNVYILAKNLKKEQMIGSIAWFFVFLNLIKLPFHIFVWDSFSREVLLLGLILVPIIYVGSRIGIVLVEYINDKTYRRLMIIVTALSAVQLII